MNSIYRNYVKRLLGIFLSVFAIPFVLFVSVPVAIANKLEDGGTVFYKGLRYGKDMKKFYEYKFRSMKMSAPDIRNADGTTYNAENDPRLTRIGGFLRKTSIDELPQFINVLRGDMSIIGPRPSPMGNEATYTDFIKRKFEVRPGITGYNQALYRNSSTLEERYKNDVYYVENVSFGFDIKILFMTVKTVLTHKGLNHPAEEKKAYRSCKNKVGEIIK